FDEELEAPIEDQPIPTDASPTALLPGYINDFNPEEDEEDLRRIMLTILPIEETMMIMSHLMMMTMMMMLKRMGRTMRRRST
nr:hypothetical protein [Tanacetum cinerariifolium]